MAQRQQRRLRLSANPMALEDPLAVPGMEEEEPLLPPEEGPVDYEQPEIEGGMYRARMSRGRAVSGPRTKLASQGQVGRIEAAVVELAENQASMARSIAGLAKAVISRKDDEDEDDDKEDKSVKKSRTAKARATKGNVESAFKPYGDGHDEGDPESQDPEESTMNEPGLQDPKGSKEVKGKVAKDDASGNFGEKDDTVPGNREAGVDEKDKPAEEYLIQGDAGDGPGPVSKAVQAELDAAVSTVLAKHGIVKKAVGPAPGNSAVETGEQPDMDGLFDTARAMSFSDLNRIRVESGELPRTLI